MHYQCPECDKEGKIISELKKNGCKCKIEPWVMLDPKDHKESKKIKSDKEELKLKIAKIKGKIGPNYVESIIVDDKPHFLCNVNDELKLAEKIIGPGSPEKLYKITSAGLETISLDSQITLEQFWNMMYIIYDKKDIKNKTSHTKYFSNYEENILNIKLEKIPTLGSMIIKNMSLIYPKPLKFNDKLFILYVLAIKKDLSLKEIKTQLKKYEKDFRNNTTITEKILNNMIEEKIIIKNTSKFQISITGLILILNYLDEAYLVRNTKQTKFIDINSDLKLILQNVKYLIPNFSRLCLEIPSIMTSLLILNYFRYVYDNSTGTLSSIQHDGAKELVILGRIMDDVNRNKIIQEFSVGHRVQESLIQKKVISDDKKSPIYDRLNYLAKICGYPNIDENSDQKKSKSEINLETEMATRDKIDFELVCHFLPNIHEWKRVDQSFQKENYVKNVAKKNLEGWEKFLSTTTSFKKWFNSWTADIIEFEQENMNKIKTNFIFNSQ